MEPVKEIYSLHTASPHKNRVSPASSLRIGILHTEYMQPAGEDQVAHAEYQLLQSAANVVAYQYLLKNPKSRLKQTLQFLQSPFNIWSFLKVYLWLKREQIQVLHVHNWICSRFSHS